MSGYSIKAEGISSDSSTDSWRHRGDLASVVVQGTFDSGTATLEMSVDGGTTWVAVDSSNAALTANGVFNTTLGECLLRVTLSGSTSPDLDVYYTDVPFRSL